MAKLIQLNAWCGRLRRRISHLVETHKPDIVHMQEAMSSPQGKTSFFDIVQITEKAMAFDDGACHTFFSPTWEKMFGEKKIAHGNAILARSPLTECYSEFTHLGLNSAFERDRDDDNIRNFQHAVTKLPNGKKVHLLNYHGYHDGGSKSGCALTQKHCARLAHYIHELKGPVILTGDFNLKPDSPSLDPLYAILNNVGHARGVTTTRNVFARSQDPVDMIWVSRDIVVHDFAVLPDLVSDHAALMLDFDIA